MVKVEKTYRNVESVKEESDWEISSSRSWDVYSHLKKYPDYKVRVRLWKNRIDANNVKGRK